LAVGTAPCLAPTARSTSKDDTQAMSAMSQSLQEISAVTVQVTEDLDKFYAKSCDQDYADHATALREISSISLKIRDDLSNNQAEEGTVATEEVAAAPPPPEPAEVIYDDPVLAKARRIAAMTNQLFEEMESAHHSIGSTREAESLKEISAVTHQVCADMLRLQQESWAAGVLKVGHDSRAASKVLGDSENDAGLGETVDDWGRESVMSTGFNKSATLSLIGNPGARASSKPGSTAGSTAGSRAGSKAGAKKVSQVGEEVEALPDFQVRLEDPADGFSDRAIARMNTAFKRFKVPDSADLHKDDVGGVLRYLGHAMTSKEHVEPLVMEVTVYDYMDFDEFICFMEKYVPYERKQIQMVFETFDEDQSGEISVFELRKLCSSLGLIPLRRMISEALKVVDQDGSGQLDFTELITFLAVYNNAEGFTKSEVMELHRSFDQWAEANPSAQGEKLMPASALSDALVSVFGLQAAEFARKYQEQLESGQGLQVSSFNPTNSEAESLRFSEFLIFARKVREGEYGKLKEQGYFEKCDLDSSGSINEMELRAALKKMGFTPLRQVLMEILKDVVEDGKWTTSSALDFDEFFDFMVIFRQRDGFSKSEVEEFRKTFLRFDEDGAGEISALELSGIFRHLGYGASLDDIRDLVAEVDANGTQQLDFQEYLRLMRNYREKELRRMMQVFDVYKDNGSVFLQKSNLADALQELDHEPPMELIKKSRTSSFDIDGFVGIVDSCRNAWVAKQRKKAGFSNQKIQELQETFQRFDKDKSGEIDISELLGILQEFGWQPKSREEQADLMKKLDMARALAREAGITDVGADGSAAIRFWSFVQLCRMLYSEHDKAEEEKMNKFMQEVQFSQVEVDQFRQIFRSWVSRAKDLDAEDEAMPQEQSQQSSDMLNRDPMKRFVKMTLGESLSAENKTALDDLLLTASCEKNPECVDFMGFLKVMRWLVDNSAVGQSKETTKKK